MTLSRRQFIRSSLALTVSSMVSAKNVPFLKQRKDLFLTDTFKERTLQQQAQYTLVFASPYATDEHEYIPHMHHEFKQIIQTLSQGKIYVELHDNNKLGAGTDLMAAVSHGQIDAALVSVSNLSRALPILDILNIPFWASDNEAYLNLITSKIWQKEVVNVIKQQGKLQILFHYLTGARTLSTTHTFDVGITHPEQLANKVLRVPASKVLNRFYQMTQAHVIELNWSKIAKMAKTGIIDVLDPGIIGLYAGPNNLRQMISTISTLNTVPDAWVNVINQNWLRQLPSELRLVVNEAAELVFKLHLNKSIIAAENCHRAFEKIGCRIISPSIDERALWQEMFGYQRPEWQQVKIQLLGSIRKFDELLEASQISSKYVLD